jgi:hypothetical protein
VPGLIYFGVLIVAVIAGVVIGGGTGTIIAAIAAALFGLTILGAVGPGGAAVPVAPRWTTKTSRTAEASGSGFQGL